MVLTEDEKAELKIRASRIFRLLTAHSRHVHSPANEETLELFETHLEAIQPYNAQVEDIIQKLRLDLDDESDREFSEQSDKFHFDYITLVAQLRGKIKMLTPAAVAVTPKAENQKKSSQFKCPKIELPKFNGDLEKWLKFRDMFEALVHNNPSLDAVEKMHYLETSLNLPPGEGNVLDNFSASGSSYEDAWKEVRMRYDDKRRILKAHFSNLLNVKNMQTESASEIRRVLDAFAANLSAFHQLGYSLTEEDDTANMFVLQMLTMKLDEKTAKDWRKFNDSDWASWTEIRKFLTAQWRSLEDVGGSDMKTTHARTMIAQASPQAENSKKKSSNECHHCSGIHFLWKCDSFRAKSTSERQQIVTRKGLCFNCLSSKHSVKQCQSQYHCQKCDKRHHTLLHPGKDQTTTAEMAPATGSINSALNPQIQPFTPVNMVKKTVPANNNLISTSPSEGVVLLSRDGKSLLSTAELDIIDSQGNPQTLRAVFDCGSETNYITRRAADLLGCEILDTCITSSGMFEKASVVRHETYATLRSRVTDFVYSLKLYVAPVITGDVPSDNIDIDQIDVPHGARLADPEFYKAKPVDLLLDADVFSEALLCSKKKLKCGLKFIPTEFGWIFMGKPSQAQSSCRTLLSSFNHPQQTGLEDLDRKLEKIIEMDEINFSTPTRTLEEKYCEEHFVSTTFRDESGRFVVRLPFKEGVKNLGHNLKNAKIMYSAIESKRKRDPVYNELYVQYMEDLIATGHLERVEVNELEGCYYMPHHGVLKLTSTSTKLRPVGNASSKSETGISLNEVLCVGPTIQPESFDILMRIRESKYVIMGDINKMYRQVWVHADQRRYLRVLWRTNMEGDEVMHYQFTTVPFGTACAPFLVIRCLNQLAEEARQDPEVANCLLNMTYVDDLFLASDDIGSGRQIRDKIRELLASAGMLVCKFAANDPELLKGLPESLVESTPTNDRSVTKALGIFYDLKNDVFTYHQPPTSGERITKAAVLSEIASLYDPIGWIGPVLLKAKLFMKKLWTLKVEWKEELSDDLQREWTDFRKSFGELSQITVARHCYTLKPVRIELHGFCDASINAYGAGVWARSEDEAGNVQISILCSKSRVAPLKQKSLARLELCGALLAAKLTFRIHGVLTAKIADVFIWCDSTIALHWITMSPSKLHTYVGNRVAAIQEIGESFTWKHISGEKNPADVISRGMAPEELITCSLWWEGPDFLQKPKQTWPAAIISINEHDPELEKEMKHTTLLNVHAPEATFFTYIETRYSSIRKLNRVIAYIRRFSNNVNPRNEKLQGDLTAEELREAETFIIKTVQSTIFAEEYQILERQRQIRQELEAGRLVEVHSDPLQRVPVIPQISKKSRIIALNPRLDKNGVIRVGGRLDRCEELGFERKHQIILPKCHLTTLIVRQIHEDNMHPLPNAMVSLVRQEYWPLRARQIIRPIIHRCITCYRAKPVGVEQLMAPLPAARVNASSPFTNTAVDYAGFYEIRSGIARHAHKLKVYIAVFKCMCTGAIHIELVADLSSKAFIDALDKFISRRGFCSNIFSDNATCFEGADHELQLIIDQMTPEVRQHCADNRINWNFTTPRAPHAGGIYESAIKSMKHHLKRVMKNSCFTYEQLQAILCKVEAVLNSRPLTPMSDDPDDLQVLTPGHFLIGRPLVARPQPNFLPEPSTRLELWQRIQQIQQKFWQAWHNDYLHNLQARPAHFRQEIQFKVGDLVLVKEPNLPPLKWVYGRIVELYPDSHRTVRNVKVKTPTGELDRNVKYLCLLPIEDQPEVGENVSDGNNSDYDEELLHQLFDD